MSISKFVTMSNGVKMPIFGLGTWQARSYKIVKSYQSSKESVISSVKTAINDGYRLIDTAAAYFNEEAIGEALAETFKEGKIKREDIFITTKCPPTFLHPQKQEDAITSSLSKLKLDYVDLYLAHFPCAYGDELKPEKALHDCKPEDIWKGLEKLYEKKLTRSIGISNFNVEQIHRISKSAKIPIHNHQVELHLYFQQDDLVEVCKKYGITVTAYAPLGSPGRTSYKLPNGFQPTWPEGPAPLENPIVQHLAKKYSKTPAQILLRHLIQKGIAVIPKSTNAKRITENHQIFDFELDENEMKNLYNVAQQPRLFWQDFLIGHPEDPYKEERGKQQKNSV
uniref:NADP-dependent oxidoreductase domain-containing protein n=1 Tax=Panagrolaimus davidi TaxID=227884 RepID=A0A914PQS2_9BILA